METKFTGKFLRKKKKIFVFQVVFEFFAADIATDILKLTIC